jgi:hypothetical protein
VDGEKNTNENKKKSTGVKFEIALACAITIALVIFLATRAWFYYSRELQTAAKVHTPYNLMITAGHKESIINLDLGNINTEEGTSEEYVFAVSGQALSGYVLQLAHTTNIPFQYTIYYAEEKNTKSSQDDVAYTTEEGTTYYYKKGNSVTGGYINLDEQTKIANDTKHETTYADYNNVQKNAEPVYWQADIQPDSETKQYGNGAQNEDNGDFVQYYILNISWDSSVKNDKETDLVYIMAG